MLEFNVSGLLIPPSIIKCTIEELERYFAVDSHEDIRRILFQKYRNYCDELKEICGVGNLTQWIDGSFVTRKENPRDIDFVSFIHYDIFENNESRLKEFIYPGRFTIQGVDSYIVKVYPKTHKLHSAYNADAAYWINQFDKTKPNKRNKRMPKGFVEIIV